MRGTKGRQKKQKFSFRGSVKDDSILIGSHGDARIDIDGNFDLSGLIYCLGYTVTLSVKGEGKIKFNGKCHRLVIKKMTGNCTLDIRNLTCREIICQSLNGKARVITGKTRVISYRDITDESELNVLDKTLMIGRALTGNARIVQRGVAFSETSEVNV